MARNLVFGSIIDVVMGVDFMRIDLMGRRCLYCVSGNLEEGRVKFTINFLSVCREYYVTVLP